MTTVLLAFLAVLVLAVFLWGFSRRSSFGRNIKTMGDYTPDRTESRRHDHDSGGSSFLTGFMVANALSPPGQTPEEKPDDPDSDSDTTDPGGAEFGAEFGTSDAGGWGGGDFGGGDGGGGDGGGGDGGD